MPERYYQEYGPIKRRKDSGEYDSDDAPTVTEANAPRPVATPIETRMPLAAASITRERIRARRRQRAGRTVLWLLLALTMVGGVVLALPYAANLVATNQALDNVSIQGTAVGRQSRAAIRAELDERYASFASTPLTLTFEGQSWTPTLTDLGVTFDLDALTEQAVGAGRSGDPVSRIRQLWWLWNNGLDVAPSLTVNSNKLQLYLTSIASQIEEPPRDAALSLTAGKVLPTPARPGRQMLVDATSIDIMRALQTLTPQEVVVRSRILAPNVDDNGIAGAVDTAKTLLQAPLVLKQGKREVVWDEETIASLVNIVTDDHTMQVVVDPDRLNRAVERLSQVVDSSSAEPRVAFRSGKPRITQPGDTGWRLKQPEAAAVISKTLLLPRRVLELPVEELTPQVTAKTLPSLGLNEVVGEGVTSFAGSAPYRITNIKAGAARMNGVLIAPGAEFSFNTQLGAVDESNGFVQGYAVIGNRTQLEWGGGVCQDSTTLFRAAFWAGLPITERHAHPFYISWYDAFAFPSDSGPGMDATIYTGVQDFKFVNDTGKWMMIEAIANEADQTLTMRLYGTKPDREVQIQGPEIDNIVPPPASPVYTTDSSLPSGTLKQTDTARRGMDISVYRVITENGVRKPAELFFTRFKAWPDVFVRGTGA